MKEMKNIIIFLKEPVEVEVNAMSGENVMATVVNKKGFTLT